MMTEPRGFAKLLNEDEVTAIAILFEMTDAQVEAMDDAALARLYDIDVSELPYYLLSNERFDELVDEGLEEWEAAHLRDEHPDLFDDLLFDEDGLIEDRLFAEKSLVPMKPPKKFGQDTFRFQNQMRKHNPPKPVQHHFELVN